MEEVLANVRSLEAECLADVAKANNVVSLIDLLCTSSWTPVVVAAMKALVRIFGGFLEQKLITSLDPHAPPSVRAGEVLTAHQQAKASFTAWAVEKYAKVVCETIKLLAADDDGMQLDVLFSLMECARMEMGETSTQERVLLTAERGTFSALVSALLSLDGVAGDTVEVFRNKYLLQFDDVRLLVYRALSRMLKVPERPLTPERLDGMFEFAGDILLPTTADEVCDFFFDTVSQHQLLRDLRMHESAFSDFWIAFLRQKLSAATFKKVLLVIDELILPRLKAPLLLIDFFQDAYSLGGVSSILALNGLFYLITRQNLDYPEFYTKLYSLLEPSCLHLRHRKRFFKLLDTFLSSPLLPAYLVASFAKRLARISLAAPPSGILIAIPMIYNILVRHPSCLPLIHRSANTASATAVGASRGSVPCATAARDPFLAEEPNPAKTNALDSSLWELVSLKAHYHPSVSRITKLFETKLKRETFVVDMFCESTYDSLLETEKSRKAAEIPMAFAEFSDLVPQDAEFSSVWNQ